jgi:hypothetical protein
MDTIGPSWVCSIGGKWNVLVIVDDYSYYSWIFFLESKDEVFEHFHSLALRLNNEHLNCLKAIHSDNVCASRPSRYVSVINDNHLVSLMNFNKAKVN